MDALRFVPLRDAFGAEVLHLDLHMTPDEQTVSEIDRAMATYGVLVIRGQSVSEDEHIAFARAFGDLDMGLSPVLGQARAGRLKYREFADVSNVDESGNAAATENRRVVAHFANQLWHSDSSYLQPSARYSMLQAVSVTSRGGNTEYADMRAAYDALDDDMKAYLADKVVEHDALHSRFALGDDDYTPEQRAAMAPVRWPLVRTHPLSGRKSLFIGAHASRVLGMPTPEGRVLLLDLLEHATQPRFTYSHRWSVGDFVIWDNRSVLHRGRPYDFSERRELRRTTNQGKSEDYTGFAVPA